MIRIFLAKGDKMTTAILAISSLSLACSAGTLYIMHRTAKKLDEAGAELKREVEVVKTKMNRNAVVMKTAISSLEL